MAEFRLSAGKISRTTEHRTVEEIWYVISGAGEMWRAQQGPGEVVQLFPGLSLTIPVGSQFQFRAGERGPLNVIGVTIPRWPGPEEAQFRKGPWEPNL
jgi:mannose-6-phosphate isomerase-like protein (cupin superfamily)